MEEKIKNIAYGVYNAINSKDTDSLRRLLATEVIRHATGEIGVEAAIAMMEKMFSASPNTHFIVEDILIDGNKVALRISIHGREAAEDKPRPTILEIFRIEDNQVVEIWGAGISPPRFPEKPSSVNA